MCGRHVSFKIEMWGDPSEGPCVFFSHYLRVRICFTCRALQPSASNCNRKLTSCRQPCPRSFTQSQRGDTRLACRNKMQTHKRILLRSNVLICIFYEHLHRHELAVLTLLALYARTHTHPISLHSLCEGRQHHEGGNGFSARATG